jgi:hypothetical protein
VDLAEARAARHDGNGTAMADALNAIEQLCDKGMASGTPWWVFRDAVRAILEKDS